ADRRQLNLAARGFCPYALRIERSLGFVRRQSTMREYLTSWWVRVGLAMLIIGTGPLLFIIAAAAVGLWPDPNPNPIGPGMLCWLTLWPSIICIVVGVVRVRSRRAAQQSAARGADLAHTPRPRL